MTSASWFAYLNKKIAIPTGQSLESLSWNLERGWIACGGEDGLLRVLKLDAPRLGEKNSSLTMNQALEGHNGNVQVLTWNENFQKLTTADHNGLIIVWILHRGMWFEEMINNRNHSHVKDMRWTTNGQKICIVYKDGYVIVGSVEGSRLWGKELNKNLNHISWSPDSKKILFGTDISELELYDVTGNFLSKVNVFAVDSLTSEMIGLEWYDGTEGYQEANIPCLAIAFAGGKIQIMRHDMDEDPVLIDTGMHLTRIQWNMNGSVLAVAGRKSSSSIREGLLHLVHFYNPWGKHLRTLKVPCKSSRGIRSIAWDRHSLRLALAVETFIYFANVRPSYNWAFFAKHVAVYSFFKPERNDFAIVFWNTQTSSQNIKYVKKVLLVSGCATSEYCCLVTRADSEDQAVLVLCNAIGSPIDTKYIDWDPEYMAMTPSHVVIASSNMVYIWQYCHKKSAPHADWQYDEIGSATSTFHIDETPSSSSRKKPEESTDDPIVALTAWKENMVIGRASGSIVRYNLQSISLIQRHRSFRRRPHLLRLNCDGSRLAVVDMYGMLSVYSIEEMCDTKSKSNTMYGSSSYNSTPPKSKLDRKDVWSICWADDDPELFAIMEKLRMYVFRGAKPQEPVISSAHICQFKDLEINTLYLDELMKDPENPHKDHHKIFHTKSLRDTHQLLETVPINEVITFVEENPHERLWRLVAEQALENLNFFVAETAFVKCNDYQGIQFVKQLKLLSNRKKQKAEVMAHFGRFDEAEQIYVKMGLKDLALDLRMRLGDWLRVVQLINQGAGDDELLTRAFKNIGDYYADRQKWEKAYKYYSKAKDLEALVRCSYYLEDWLSLEKLVQRVHTGAPLLGEIGKMFVNVGLCAEAVTAFIKLGDVKAAIDTCITLNHWDLAIELTEKHASGTQAEPLLAQYANHLLQKGQVFQAIELYRKAGKHMESARLLAKEASSAGQETPLICKKLAVLSALEVEAHRKRIMSTHGEKSGGKSTVDKLLEEDRMYCDSSHFINNSWHTAEAYHFFILSQRHLYSGNLVNAMQTALQLRAYEDVLTPVAVNSLIALSSFYAKYYGICSKALTKLECLPFLNPGEKKNYRKLSIQIFTRYEPKDPLDSVVAISSRDKKLPIRERVCVATGASISDCPISEVVICSTCKHRALASETRNSSFCMLCHHTI